MISPREKFKAGQFGPSWQALVDSQQFHAAAETALIESQFRLPVATDMVTAAACHQRMEGARDFLRILMGLTEPPEKSAPPEKPRLNYNT